MDDYAIGDQWSVFFDPAKNTQDYRDFYNSVGWQVAGPSDPLVATNVRKANQIAKTTGDKNLEYWTNFILTYGDKALTSLTKNGIIKNQNLLSGGYSFIDTDTGQRVTKDDVANQAPDTTSRVFNIDFTDPTVLLICLIIVLVLFYFLFFYKSSKGKK